MFDAEYEMKKAIERLEDNVKEIISKKELYTTIHARFGSMNGSYLSIWSSSSDLSFRVDSFDEVADIISAVSKILGESRDMVKIPESMTLMFYFPVCNITVFFHMGEGCTLKQVGETTPHPIYEMECRNEM